MNISCINVLLPITVSKHGAVVEQRMIFERNKTNSKGLYSRH